MLRRTFLLMPFFNVKQNHLRDIKKWQIFFGKGLIAYIHIYCIYGIDFNNKNLKKDEYMYKLSSVCFMLSTSFYTTISLISGYIYIICKEKNKVFLLTTNL